METWDAIRARRNVRQYSDRPISSADLDRILEAGRRTPSSMNEQRWDFVVVTDRDQLQELARVWRYGRHVATGGKPFSVSSTISNTAFWLVILFFLPAILDQLALPGLLTPVQSMINRIFLFLPNLLAAAVIFAVGWFVATVVKRVLTGVLAAVGVDRLSERLGISRALGSQTKLGEVLDQLDRERVRGVLADVSARVMIIE